MGIPIYPVLGNHDAFPHNQFSDDPNHMLYAITAEMWGDLGWPAEALQEYKQNGRLGFFLSASGLHRTGAFSDSNSKVPSPFSVI